jgi:hypothetical protein
MKKTEIKNLLRISESPLQQCAADYIEELERENAGLKQISGELCELCGWAMKFPDQPCRCELERENASLKEHMTEAWKLVNAMAGQEYWQRAEEWLEKHAWAKPKDMNGKDDLR